MYIIKTMRRQLIRFIESPSTFLPPRSPLLYYIPGMKRPEVKVKKDNILALLHSKCTEYQLSDSDTYELAKITHHIQKDFPRETYIPDDIKILGVKPSSLSDNILPNINHDTHRVMGNFVRQWVYLSPVVAYFGSGVPHEVATLAVVVTIFTSCLTDDVSPKVKECVYAVNSIFEKYEVDAIKNNIRNITKKPTE